MTLCESFNQQSTRKGRVQDGLELKGRVGDIPKYMVDKSKTKRGFYKGTIYVSHTLYSRFSSI